MFDFILKTQFKEHERRTAQLSITSTLKESEGESGLGSDINGTTIAADSVTPANRTGVMTGDSDQEKFSSSTPKSRWAAFRLVLCDDDIMQK